MDIDVHPSLGKRGDLCSIERKGVVGRRKATATVVTVEGRHEYDLYPAVGTGIAEMDVCSYVSIIVRREVIESTGDGKRSAAQRSGYVARGECGHGGYFGPPGECGRVGLGG